MTHRLSEGGWEGAGPRADAATPRDACDSAMNKGHLSLTRPSGGQVPGFPGRRRHGPGMRLPPHLPPATSPGLFSPKVPAEARVATATGHFDAAPAPKPRTQLPFPERVQPPWQQTGAEPALTCPAERKAQGEGDQAPGMPPASRCTTDYLTVSPPSPRPPSNGNGVQPSAPQAHTVPTPRDSGSGF